MHEFPYVCLDGPSVGQVNWMRRIIWEEAQSYGSSFLVDCKTLICVKVILQLVECRSGDYFVNFPGKCLIILALGNV